MSKQTTMRKLTSIIIFSILFCGTALSQNLENVGGTFRESLRNPIRVNGGLSMGTIVASGNDPRVDRQPFTYFINGNINFNLFGVVNTPFSLNLTNLGAHMSYPSLPNRFSLHPSYRWATAHIGDIAMSFSPYTLSGHQFTGAGLELTPGRFQIALMGGRLLREVRPNPELPSLLPNNARFGYGARFQYASPRITAGGSFFAGRDRENPELTLVLDSLGRAPKQNTAVSLNTTINLIENLTLMVEYGFSALTSDARALRNDNPSFLESLFGGNSSTNFYNAINVNLNYQFLRSVIGIGYERIDPQYATLGAYFFNNDFENITVHFARPFLREDRANIAVRFGLQQDNLDNTQREQSTRYVGSINLNYNPTENLQMSFSYSTFQSHRNLRSQFDFINELTPYDNLDTLRFSQLSQNLDMMVMYNIRRTETTNQSVNLMLSYQEAANRQGNLILPGNVSRFVNSAMGYSIQFIPQAVSVSASLNGTYSYMIQQESFTFGPMVSVTAGFFNRTLTVGYSTGYNVNIISGTGVQAQVLNMRGHVAYRFARRHSLTASVVWQYRNVKDRDPVHLTTGTINYAFTF